MTTDGPRGRVLGLDAPQGQLNFSRVLGLGGRPLVLESKSVLVISGLDSISAYGKDESRDKGMEPTQSLSLKCHVSV